MNLSPARYVQPLGFLIGWMFLLLPSLTKSQDVDSLKTEIISVWQTDPTGAISKTKDIWRRSVAEEDFENQAWALNFQGVVFGALGEFDSSYHYYNQSLVVCREHEITSVEKKTLMNLAINYQYQGQYEKSLNSYLDAIRAFEATKDTLGLGHAYSGLGGVHRFLDEEETAISDYKKSIGYYEMLGRTDQMAPIYSNLGVIYRDRNARDSAQHFFTVAADLFEPFGSSIGRISLFVNRAGLYEKTQPDSAKYYYGVALKDANELNYSRGIVMATTGLSEIELRLKNYAQAGKIAQGALQKAEEIGDLEFQKRTLAVLVEVADHQGQTARAYQYQRAFQAVSDSILNIEKQKAVAEMEIKFETEKKEREIAEQAAELAEQRAHAADLELESSRRKRIIGILISVALGLALLGVVIFRYQTNLRKKAQEQLALQQSLENTRREKALSDEKLRISRELHDNIGSQITFLISSLDNLQYVQKDEQSKKKLENLSGFARNAITDLRHTIWALNQDISLKGLVTRIGDLTGKISSTTALKVTVSDETTTDPMLSSTAAINLMRIVQEALQNAARHSGGDEVKLSIRSDAKGLEIRIADNGEGFSPDEIKSGGFGLQNQRQRAAAIGAELAFNSRPGAGTEVLVKYS